MKPCGFQIRLDLTKTKNNATLLFVHLINAGKNVDDQGRYNAKPDHPLRWPRDASTRRAFAATAK